MLPAHAQPPVADGIDIWNTTSVPYHPAGVYHNHIETGRNVNRSSVGAVDMPPVQAHVPYETMTSGGDLHRPPVSQLPRCVPTSLADVRGTDGMSLDEAGVWHNQAANINDRINMQLTIDTMEQVLRSHYGGEHQPVITEPPPLDYHGQQHHYLQQHQQQLDLHQQHQHLNPQHNAYHHHHHQQQQLEQQQKQQQHPQQQHQQQQQLLQHHETPRQRQHDMEHMHHKQHLLQQQQFQRQQQRYRLFDQSRHDSEMDETAVGPVSFEDRCPDYEDESDRAGALQSHNMQYQSNYDMMSSSDDWTLDAAAVKHPAYHHHDYTTTHQVQLPIANRASRVLPTPTLQCPLCHKRYCRKSTLRSHLKHHDGRKPYICQHCGKAFSQTANLSAHQRIHTGEKPFKCSICARPFSQSSSLVTHRRTHTGEKPYPCVHCSKRFADSSTLAKHVRTHTGSKPYECDVCGQRFSQSGNLHRHVKTHRQHDP